MAEAAIDADAHAGKLLVVPGQHFRKNVEKGAFIGADGKRARGHACLIGNGMDRPGLQRQHLAGVVQHDLARRSEADGLGGTVKQLLTVLLLQLADLRADGRLGTENLFRGTGKTAQAGDFHESLELVEIHAQVQQNWGDNATGEKPEAVPPWS